MSARFGVVGSGWRTQFFLRLAPLVPADLTVTGVVTRTAQRGAQIQAEWDEPAFRTHADLAATAKSDFVVASVPWPVTPQVTTDAVHRGLHVLAETPPAPDAAGLRELWNAVGTSGHVKVAEQYLLMPGHAARRAVLREGVIGQVTSVQVSSTHLCHATSMIRNISAPGSSRRPSSPVRSRLRWSIRSRAPASPMPTWPSRPFCGTPGVGPAARGRSRTLPTEGWQDHLLGVAIEEAARTGTPVTTGREAWAD
jgi:hypothetical protein